MYRLLMVDIKALKEERDALKLKAEIKKLGGGTTNTPVKKPVVQDNYSSRTTKEINELQEKKKSLKGFRGFVQKLSINAAINQRRAGLNAVTRTEAMGHQTVLLRKQLEYEKAKKELNEVRKSNQIDFNPYTVGKKNISVDDIFK